MKVRLPQRWSRSTRVRNVIGSLVRGRSRFMNRKKQGAYLDIGCGWNIGPGRINLDYEWHPGIDICADITAGLPLPDNYLGGIFSEHCIEHISLRSALTLFAEMYRTLMPGRYVRIIVPGLEIYLDRYRDGRPMPFAEDDAILGPLCTGAVGINRIMRAHGHQFIYDFATLSAALATAGFTEIRQCRLNEGSDPRLLTDTPERAAESLYVEARKPV